MQICCASRSRLAGLAKRARMPGAAAPIVIVVTAAGIAII
jgi:hypothetical protein